MLLSIIIPVLDERATLATVIQRVSCVLTQVAKEIIVIDDGSVDGTRTWLEHNFPHGAWSGSGIGIDNSGTRLAFCETVPSDCGEEK